MTTSYVEGRSAHAIVNHPIPPITDPMGSSWDQPSREAIIVDDKHALMGQHTFDELSEYSCSQPSGVYPGKMWRRHNGAFDRDFLARGGKPEWWLCWFDVSEKGPDWCATRHRKILIV